METKATLYTLNAMEVHVSGEYYSWINARPFRAFDGRFLTPMDSTVDISRLPMHHTARVDRGGAVQHDYIVIAPDLHEILNLPYKAKMTELSLKLTRMTEQAASAKKVVDGFNALPWYRRAWLALKGGI